MQLSRVQNFGNFLDNKHSILRVFTSMRYTYHVNSWSTIENKKSHSDTTTELQERSNQELEEIKSELSEYENQRFYSKLR